MMPVDDTLSDVTPLALIDGTNAATRAGHVRRARRPGGRAEPHADLAAPSVHPPLFLLPFLDPTIAARRPTHR